MLPLIVVHHYSPLLPSIDVVGMNGTFILNLDLSEK
jgi:hypothetical protein